MSTTSRILAATARHRWVGPLVALILVCVLFSFLAPDTFPRTATLIAMARQTSVVGIAATGATLIIILAGIDLSVGSAVALTTVVIALALKANLGPAVAVILGTAVAMGTGLLNGALTVALDITPFIVTLGTMSILRGLAKGLAHEERIYVDAHGLDALMLPDSAILGVPLAVWIMIGVAVSTAVLLDNTRLGREMFAVGSNERTALLAGIRVKYVKILTYGIAGVLVGVAGLLEFSRLTVGDPTDSIGLELDVIASSVIGGASLNGGEGSVIGTILGAMLMTAINTGCRYMGLPSWLQQILTGGIIIAAVGLDRFRQKRV